MKKSVKILLVVVFCGMGVFLGAQDGGNVRDSIFNKILEKRMVKMKEKLNLSEEQAQKVKAIFVQSHDKMKAIRMEEKKALEGVLNPEQFNKLSHFVEHKMEKRLRHGGWRP